MMRGGPPSGLHVCTTLLLAVLLSCVEKLMEHCNPNVQLVFLTPDVLCSPLAGPHSILGLWDLQVLHLLRLLPDFELWIKVLVALWPVKWDRGNVVDLIMDLDHTVALPPAQHKVGGEGGPMSPLATTAGAQGSGSTSVNSWTRVACTIGAAAAAGC
ncbi:hypothetical protein VaNZ11_004442 [Volvox africanus]|uniref:Secreted protein n=1 Tax=Volvox africanus TaxID=51714 RepID=A0ABQ5RXI0_9CHLO|nr:hypothetical protein VaNZ11_004442 [Volvox africanus]